MEDDMTIFKRSVKKYLELHDLEERLKEQIKEMKDEKEGLAGLLNGSRARICYSIFIDNFTVNIIGSIFNHSCSWCLVKQDISLNTRQQ